MHRRHFLPYCLGLVAMGLILTARPVLAQTNQGTDFWLAETTNTLDGISASVFAIAIANPSGATANVTIAHFGDPDVLDTVPSGGLETFTFPRAAVCANGGNNLGKDMVYHVTSDVDVVVYIFNPLDTVFTNDASLVLPVPALGKLHRAGSYINPLGNSVGAFVGVVAVQNSTNIQIFDDSNVLVDNQTIDQGEYYQYVGDCFGPVPDTTGWRIVTSVPAAVFSGSNCSSIGSSTGACDHLEEQILPEEAVAPTYVACPTLTRPVGCDPAIPGACSPDIFRYVATVANTTVTTSPAVGNAVLTNPGDFLEVSTSTPHVVTADQPIYGYQYLVSQDSGPPPAGTGDPSMLDMPPVDQLQFNYIFLAPNTYAFDFINVIAPVGTVLTMDGNPVLDVCAPVGMIDTVNYCCLRKQVSDGVHTIAGTNRFGLSVSGFDNFASYAYIGGVGLQPINAGCSTGGPYQTETCAVPTQVQLDGTPSCSDASTPVVLWTSTDGVTFSDPTIADPVATVPNFGVSNICMTVTCAGEQPVQCCSTINVQQAANCSTPQPTLTPTPVPTSTTLPPLNHFQCYEVHAPNNIISGISLADQFGPSTVQLIEPRRFCAPANKNDEDPTAVTDPDHLAGYRLRQTTPKFKRIRGFFADNQFGTHEDRHHPARVSDGAIGKEPHRATAASTREPSHRSLQMLPRQRQRLGSRREGARSIRHPDRRFEAAAPAVRPRRQERRGNPECRVPLALLPGTSCRRFHAAARNDFRQQPVRRRRVRALPSDRALCAVVEAWSRIDAAPERHPHAHPDRHADADRGPADAVRNAHAARCRDVDARADAHATRCCNVDAGADAHAARWRHVDAGADAHAARRRHVDARADAHAARCRNVDAGAHVDATRSRNLDTRPTLTPPDLATLTPEPTLTPPDEATLTPEPTLTPPDEATLTPEPTLTPPDNATPTPLPTPFGCTFDPDEMTCGTDCPPGFECSETALTGAYVRAAASVWSRRRCVRRNLPQRRRPLPVRARRSAISRHRRLRLRAHRLRACAGVGPNCNGLCPRPGRRSACQRSTILRCAPAARSSSEERDAVTWARRPRHPSVSATAGAAARRTRRRRGRSSPTCRSTP